MDNTAEQLRECREAFETWVLSDDFWDVETIQRDDDGKYVDEEAFLAWNAWQAAWNTRSDSGEAVAFDGPKDDRAMLLYLMQAFDSESWQCPKCGHDEDTATMDSAYFLRGYLIAHPSATADQVRDAARYRWLRGRIDPYDGTPFICIYHLNFGCWNGEHADREIDGAIDAALASKRGE